MIDVDFQNEEVKEAIGKLAAETGMSLDELLKQYDYAEKHKTYVRFIKGISKGKVGYYFPSPILNPYSRDVYCSDGSIVVTMGWNHSYERITEEEYLMECKENNDD